MKVKLLRNILHIRWYSENLRKQTWLSLIVVLLAGLVLTCLIINRLEDKSYRLKDLYETFETVMPFLLGEYEKPIDIKLNETSKKVLFFLFIFGVLVLAGVIGKIASFFVKGEEMHKKFRNHIVICNWNERGDRIIKEIHSPLAAPEKEIVVIGETDIKKEELDSNTKYKRVHFVNGDPTLHDVLKKNCVHRAKSVIILADSKSSDPDAKSALIHLAITNLIKGTKRKPRIVAEVISHQKTQHLKTACVDELVCPTDYGLGIIAQCALKPKLTEVYQELLEYSKKNNEIYMVEKDRYPEDFENETFEEVSRLMSEKRNPRNPAILLGIKRNNQVMLNPKKKEFEKIQKGDTLIVMAFKEPDLKKDLKLE